MLHEVSNDFVGSANEASMHPTVMQDLHKNGDVGWTQSMLLEKRQHTIDFRDFVINIMLLLPQRTHDGRQGKT